MTNNVNAVNVLNWEHGENFIRRSDGLISTLLTWVDDMKKWPEETMGLSGVDGAACKGCR